MLNATQNAAVVLIIVACSLLFMAVVNRFWPAPKRSINNDIIGWHLGILGTTYAVIMGFMLYTVWTNYGIAELNADSEANSLMNVYRLADGLPDQQRTQIRNAARLYADVVVEQDWPAMASAEASPLKSHGVMVKMWGILTSVKTASPPELTAEDHALYELSEVATHRQMRQLQSNTNLPPVLWFVLNIGAVVTIASCCLFGSVNVWLHALQVFAFSLLVGLVLIAIADIDRPFQGSVRVSNIAFVRAQINMAEE